jgi:hypothetical protein
MILGTVYSVNQVPIRLTEERWEHINDSHPEEFDYNDHDEILDAVEIPTYILQGKRGTLIAVEPKGKQSFLYVVYREVSASDGFIITAFHQSSLDRDKIVWRADEQ